MSERGMIYIEDNIHLLNRWYGEGKTKFIDLVYNDVPYNSKKEYCIIFNTDTKTAEIAYLDMFGKDVNIDGNITIRYFDVLNDFIKIDINFYNFLVDLHKILPDDSLKSYTTFIGISNWYIHKALKSTGSLYHQCDQNTSHYMKVVLDYIYGKKNFKNEICWCYKTGGAGSKHYPRKHDSILFYTKSDKYTFNVQYKDRESVYMDNGRRDGKVHIDEKNGREFIYQYPPNHPSKKRGTKIYMQYMVRDWWNDIKPIHHNSLDRRYPTQKPVELIDRIIKTSSNENDVVADFYMGGGTTAVSAIKLKRKFICSDINYRSLSIVRERIEELKLIPKKDYFIYGVPQSSVELRELVKANIYGSYKNSLFAFESVIIKCYLIGVQGNSKKVGDSGIDGRFGYLYKKKNYTGYVQVTTSARMNHFKSFCSMVAKGDKGCIGVYVTFEDTLTSGIIKEAKSYGKVFGVDKVQILTVENLIDRGIQYQTPSEILTV